MTVCLNVIKKKFAAVVEKVRKTFVGINVSGRLIATEIYKTWYPGKKYG